MPKLVCPLFYEESGQGSAKEKRLIVHKYIYSVSRAADGSAVEVCEYYTNKDGQLNLLVYMLGDTQTLLSPLFPGEYNFFVTKQRITDPAPCEVLQEIHCEKRTITDQENQVVVLPSCRHADGAEKVADFILGEIQRNVESAVVQQLYFMNTHDEPIREASQLAPSPPLPMKPGAFPLWASKVGPGMEWDHKPYISEKKKA